MGIRSALTTLFTLLLVVVALSLIMGTLLGQPVLLSYVETGSMQPTLDPGDGFIAIPAQVAGPVEEGDVVTFRAEKLHGGGLTTHRVVGRTDRGYITQGDANSFTDQSGVEPPVKDAQVVAVTVQVGENVVAIPHFGTVATGSRDVLTAVQKRLSTLVGSRALLGAQGIAYLFFAATMLAYLFDLFRKRGKKGRSRNRTRDTGVDVRLIAGGFAILLVLGATASMVAPAGTQQYGVVSAEFESDRPDVIPSGESKNRTYPVSNNGVIPVHVFLEPASQGIDVTPQELSVAGNDYRNATVTLSAPPQTGYNRRFLVEHRYLAVLPPSMIRALYQVHPWLPIIAIDALIGIPFYLLSVRLIGSGRIRSRSRDAPSVLQRLRSRFT